jgi:hypothetical protein
VRDYFGMHRIDDGDEVAFQLPYGEWIRLFRANGFEVLDLIEPRPAPDAVSTYRDDEERAWSRRWPAECICGCTGPEHAAAHRAARRRAWAARPAPCDPRRRLPISGR